MDMSDDDEDFAQSLQLEKRSDDAVALCKGDTVRVTEGDLQHPARCSNSESVYTTGRRFSVDGRGGGTAACCMLALGPRKACPLFTYTRKLAQKGSNTSGESARARTTRDGARLTPLTCP